MHYIVVHSAPGCHRLWRRHSCLPGPGGTPDSSGRLPDVHQRASRKHENRGAATRSAIDAGSILYMAYCRCGVGSRVHR